MLSHNALFLLIQYMYNSSNPPMRNFLIAVNIILSRSRWATLYLRGNWLFWRLGKTSITTLGKRASCKLPLSSYTNERMERRIFFHNSWTINMHMFKILLPELLLKIDAFYL